jgi:hypothetical protein
VRAAHHHHQAEGCHHHASFEADLLAFALLTFQQISIVIIDVFSLVTVDRVFLLSHFAVIFIFLFVSRS